MFNKQQYTATTIIQYKSAAEFLIYSKYLSDMLRSHSHVFAP